LVREPEAADFRQTFRAAAKLFARNEFAECSGCSLSIILARDGRSRSGCSKWWAAEQLAK
jgi:hypothetical protein